MLNPSELLTDRKNIFKLVAESYLLEKMTLLSMHSGSLTFVSVTHARTHTHARAGHADSLVLILHTTDTTYFI